MGNFLLILSIGFMYLYTKENENKFKLLACILMLIGVIINIFGG